MRNSNNQLSPPKTLLKLVKNQKIITIDQLKNYLNTNSRMTVFRKLKPLRYISSYSHSGKFYTLKRIVKFDDKGIWKYNTVYFSENGTLKNTLRYLIDESDRGYDSMELKNILGVKVDDALLNLLKEKVICREKNIGVFIYYSSITKAKKSQLFQRNSAKLSMGKLVTSNSHMTDEIYAALILFYTILDEKQRRLYSGLESLKIGRGGDSIIADIFNINVKTVLKGRKELIGKHINTDTVRFQGGGRKPVKKTLI